LFQKSSLMRRIKKHFFPLEDLRVFRFFSRTRTKKRKEIKGRLIDFRIFFSILFFQSIFGSFGVEKVRKF